MLDASFVGNINYVTRTIQTTKDLILSIEDDIQEVKTLMNHSITSKIDKYQLLGLVEQENQQLKVLLLFLCSIYVFNSLYLATN